MIAKIFMHVALDNNWIKISRGGEDTLIEVYSVIVIMPWVLIWGLAGTGDYGLATSCFIALWMLFLGITYLISYLKKERKKDIIPSEYDNSK
jgi:hypothetical protein